MKASVVSQLLDLNRTFYQTFGAAFAATRRRIQPGVRQVIAGLPVGSRLLDLGCGSGALALELDKIWPTGSYLGLDSSRELLSAAREAVRAAHPGGVDIRFALADLSNPDWIDLAAATTIDVCLAFAVLHHLPGSRLREQVVRLVASLLPESGLLIHSEWQFQHSPRLMKRVQPWSAVGLSGEDVDPGDCLIDWRYALPGQPEPVGLRYVHLFTREELGELAVKAGFEIRSTFESDGEGGKLGLYQVWVKN
jgi:tRNA (uracil-5-)-methyltransferase TRM9